MKREVTKNHWLSPIIQTDSPSLYSTNNMASLLDTISLPHSFIVNWDFQFINICLAIMTNNSGALLKRRRMWFAKYEWVRDEMADGLLYPPLRMWPSLFYSKYTVGDFDIKVDFYDPGRNPIYICRPLFPMCIQRAWIVGVWSRTARHSVYFPTGFLEASTCLIFRTDGSL